MRFLQSRGSTSSILRNVEKYKVCILWVLSLQTCMELMAQVATQALNQSEVLPTGPFYLFVSPKSVPEEITDSRHILFNFMNFLLTVGLRAS